MDWSKLISQSVGPDSINDIRNYTYETETETNSAIDRFYTDSRSIITLVLPGTNKTEWLGSLALVALVSTTENYFRNILFELITLCPTTRKNAASNPINLGSAIWFKEKSLEKGAFEHYSFSESKKIIDATRKYIGLELKNTGLIPIIEEFNKICELRHAIVHSSRFLSGRNAINLEIPSSEKEVMIGVGYSEIQEAASICNTLIIAYNQLIFKEIAKRWVLNWRIPNWTTKEENTSFKKTWDIFYSKIDKSDGTILEVGSWIKCKNLIKKEYDV